MTSLLEDDPECPAIELREHASDAVTLELHAVIDPALAYLKVRLHLLHKTQPYDDMTVQIHQFILIKAIDVNHSTLKHEEFVVKTVWRWYPDRT